MPLLKLKGWWDVCIHRCRACPRSSHARGGIVNVNSVRVSADSGNKRGITDTLFAWVRMVRMVRWRPHFRSLGIELEGEMGDATFALQARHLSQALRKLTSSLSKSIVDFFINQIRQRLVWCLVVQKSRPVLWRSSLFFGFLSVLVFLFI
jgi:hypothetical protein